MRESFREVTIARYRKDYHLQSPAGIFLKNNCIYPAGYFPGKSLGTTRETESPVRSHFNFNLNIDIDQPYQQEDSRNQTSVTTR